MWFKVAPGMLDPIFRAISMHYQGSRMLVRVALRPEGGRFAEIQDEHGNVLRTFINGLPNRVELDLSSSASCFRLELLDRSIIQPLRPTALNSRPS